MASGVAPETVSRVTDEKHGPGLLGERPAAE
jgi:hypothetical protein